MKRRDPWWGYMKEILRRYPDVESFEKHAIDTALDHMAGQTDGESKIYLIRLVFFHKTHTLAGAACIIPVSYNTAKRWQQEFIRAVACHIKCDGLLKHEPKNSTYCDTMSQ